MLERETVLVIFEGEWPAGHPSHALVGVSSDMVFADHELASFVVMRERGVDDPLFLTGLTNEEALAIAHGNSGREPRVIRCSPS